MVHGLQMQPQGFSVVEGTNVVVTILLVVGGWVVGGWVVGGWVTIGVVDVLHGFWQLHWHNHQMAQGGGHWQPHGGWVNGGAVVGGTVVGGTVVGGIGVIVVAQLSGQGHGAHHQLLHGKHEHGHPAATIYWYFILIF